MINLKTAQKLINDFNIYKSNLKLIIFKINNKSLPDYCLGIIKKPLNVNTNTFLKEFNNLQKQHYLNWSDTDNLYISKFFINANEFLNIYYCLRVAII